MDSSQTRNVLVTGSRGFIGRNLIQVLSRRNNLAVSGFDLGDSKETLQSHLRQADVVFHLAGVNRPLNTEDFFSGNAGFTREIVDALREYGRKPVIAFSSSTQADLDNPYAVSKRSAEQFLLDFSRDTGAQVVLFRFPNVFGKWCRPNYNSVVATFCHNIARDIPITISDPERSITLIYIDDVVQLFLDLVDESAHDSGFREPIPTHSITLGDLADLIHRFRSIRTELVLPNFEHPFVKKLYATYLSYLDPSNFDYALDQRKDPRGALAELMKSPSMGQIFVSRTLPGITRGNHYHDTKTEKFCVVEGQAIIRFRHVQGTEILSYRVSGSEFRVVDIPPGYTHSIENVGDREMVVLFWASEPFDQEYPDTHFLEVQNA